MKFKNVSCAIAALSVLLLSIGCGTKTEQEESSNNDSMLIDTSLSAQKVRNIFFAIPSPVELSQLLESTGASYDASLLNDVNNIKKYNTTIAKAFNLGVYGTDLSFTSIFDQTQESMLYVKCTSAMAGSLGITSAFNNETMQRMDANKGERDSLLSIITQSYYETDEFLQQDQRGNLSAIVIAGGWIEALYLSCKLAEKNPGEMIYQRIADLKFSLENLIGLCELYMGQEGIDELTTDLKGIKNVYDGLKVTTSETKVGKSSDGKMATVGGGSKVQLTNDSFQDIFKLGSALRNKIISRP